MLESITVETFANRIGQRFRVPNVEGEPIELELIEAAELPSPPSETRSQFSLLLKGPRDRILEQQIVNLHHDELGELALFLVPLEPAKEHALYEVVFT